MAAAMPLALGLRMPTLPSTAAPASRRPTLVFRHLAGRPPRTSRIPHRLQSSRPPAPPPSSSSTPAADAATAAAEKKTGRLDRVLQRTQRFLPRRFHGSLAQFRSAPVSHVGAFLLLHELTAIAPIFALTGAFHYLDVVPAEYVFGWWAPYVQEGGARMLRYFRRKGWFGLAAAGDADALKGEERLERELADQQREAAATARPSWLQRWTTRHADTDADAGDADAATPRTKTDKALDAAKAVKRQVTWDNSEMGYKLGIQIVAAYAITKMLLIPRVALSLWLTPSVARAMVWSRKRVFGR